VNPDQELFDYIGWVGANGGNFYSDASDHNWPGAILLHEISIRIFGAQSWTFRIFDYLLMLCGAFALASLLRQARMIVAAWLVIPVYQLMYTTSGYWFAGQRDIIAANFLFIAAAVFLSGLRKVNFLLLAISGAVVGYATLIRPTYMSYAVGLWLLTVLASVLTTSNCTPQKELKFRTGTSVLLGWATVLMAALAWGAISGNLGDWYEQALLFNLHLSFEARGNSIVGTLTRLSTMAYSWHWYIVFSFVGFLIWLKRGGISVELFTCIGVGAVGLVSAIVQKAGFGYHLGALLPMMATMIAIFLAQLIVWWYTNPKSVVAATVTCLFLSIAAGGLVKKSLQFSPQVSALLSDNPAPIELSEGEHTGPSTAELHQVAKYISDHTAQNEHILVWSRNVHVIFLSNRVSSTHFINIGMLTNMTNSFGEFDEWKSEFEKDLKSNPPKLLITQNASTSSEYDKLFTENNSNEFVNYIRTMIQQKYTLAKKFKSLDVYVLSPAM
jgi:hypothetical protein